MVRSALKMGFAHVVVPGWTDGEAPPRAREYYLGMKDYLAFQVSLALERGSLVLPGLAARPLLFLSDVDVLFQRGPSHLIEAFDMLDADVILGSEADCWPPRFRSLYAMRRKTRGTFPYVNGGTVVGRHPHFTDFLNATMQDKPEYEQYLVGNDTSLPGHLRRNDQLIKARLFLDGYPVAVDREARITLAMLIPFADLNATLAVDPHRGVWVRHGHTTTPAASDFPVALHFNGVAKERRPEGFTSMATIRRLLLESEAFQRQESQAFAKHVHILDPDLRPLSSPAGADPYTAICRGS